MRFLEFFIFLKQHFILVCIWCCLLIMVCYSVVTNWIRERFEVSCNQLVLLMNKKNAIVIDIRNQHDYSYGYIIGSMNVPFKNIKKDSIVLFRKFKNKPIIIIGNSIKESCSIQRYLKNMDFQEVYVLQGGIDNWKNHDFPVLSKK